MNKLVIDDLVHILINQIQLSDMKCINLNGRLYRPHEKDDLLKQLSLLDNHGDETTSISSYLDSLNSTEMEFYYFIKKNIPLTDSMNPHADYPLKDYFISELEDTRLPHLEQFDSLLEYEVSTDGESDIKLISKNKTRGGVIQIGEKGSGKTFSQNIWLYNNNNKLEDLNIFWVRLDASKLMNIWDTTYFDNPNITTIEEYFFGQMAYVFAKHFKKDFPLSSKLFCEIASGIEKDNINQIEKTSINTYRSASSSTSPEELFSFTSKNKGWDTILDVLNDFENQIAIYEEFNIGDGRKEIKDRFYNRKSFLVDKVFIDSQNYTSDRYKGSKNSWIQVGKILRRYVIDNGYFILYIVDGLDNVNFFNKNCKNYLEKLMDQLYTFPLYSYTSHPNELVLISLRDTTYESLKKFKTNKKYVDREIYKDISRFYKIKQYSVGLQKPILERRIEYVLENYHGEDCYMKSVVKEMVVNHFVPEEQRWNSNIRCFLSNHLSLAKLVTYRYYYANRPSTFNIKEQIDVFEDINYLINGHLFLNNYYTPTLSNDGFNLFNLFGYIEISSGKPNYLIYLRIMQIIQNEPSITESQLKKTTDYFDLPPKDTDFCLEYLIKTGLVKSHYTPEDSDPGKYWITAKGVFAIKKFLSDIHFLYHACIDTKLPYIVLQKVKLHYNNYSVRRSNKTFYPPNCIKTGLLFLEFIKKCNNEKLSIAHNIKDIDISKYQLPNYDKELGASIKNLVISCLNDDDYKDALYSYFSL